MTNHGGKRDGAGRPKGSGQYGESTQSIRIPLSRLPFIKRLLTSDNYNPGLPFFSTTVRAGLPTPIADNPEEILDLNAYVTAKTHTTFLVTASGDSMINAGIHEGDLLVVNKVEQANCGDIVIATINGEATVKRLNLDLAEYYLIPENPCYQPIKITPDLNFNLLGVVTHVIHPVK